MEEKVLSIINTEMVDMGLNYSYMTYEPDGDPVYPYITSEYSERGWTFEDGRTESSMLLELWGNTNELELIKLKEKIKKRFSDFHHSEKGLSIHISYSGSTPGRDANSNIKKRQITLEIKVWESEE